MGTYTAGRPGDCYALQVWEGDDVDTGQTVYGLSLARTPRLIWAKAWVFTTVSERDRAASQINRDFLDLSLAAFEQFYLSRSEMFPWRSR